MSELETRLRDLLDEVAPVNPQTMGLVDGARAQATRMRRQRTAMVAAVLVLVLVGGGALASWGFRDRALVPADRVTHLTCALMGRALPPEPVSAARPTSTSVREVLACPSSNGSSSAFALPESEPVSATVDLDYLRFEPPATGAACPNLPTGHLFRMLFLGTDGRPRGLDNTALACNGWPALDRYAVALGDQQSTEQAAQLSDPFPQCPSVLGRPLNPTSGQAPALPRGTRIVAASSCLHPLSYPESLPVVVTVKRRALSAAELGVLNEALALAGSVKRRAESCPGPRVGAEAVVHAVTSTGQDVTLTHVCPDSYQMVVNWNEDDIVTFTQKTFDALGGS